MAQFEEPAECRECGLEFEASEAIACSLDSLDPNPGLDYFCPSCESQDIVFHRTAEDK